MTREPPLAPLFTYFGAYKSVRGDIIKLGFANSSFIFRLLPVDGLWWRHRTFLFQRRQQVAQETLLLPIRIALMVSLCYSSSVASLLFKSIFSVRERDVSWEAGSVTRWMVGGKIFMSWSHSSSVPHCHTAGDLVGQTEVPRLFSGESYN